MSEKMKDNHKITFIRGATTASGNSAKEMEDAVVGLINELILSLWYSLLIMLMHPVINPNVATEKRELSFIPPHKPIIQKRIPVNDAVLKLGCFSINKINKPNEAIDINFLSFFTRFQ